MEERDATFAVTIDRDGERVRLQLRGELDLASAPVLERAVGRVLGGLTGAPAAVGPGAVTALELHLAQLEFVDLQGVRALCRCAARATEHGAQFALHAVTDQARRAFGLCGVTEMLAPASALD